tara:strand:+ start:1350 stop:1832 length:483 start_codon:yes stop_codon:yes gene_type:complete
MPTQEDNQIGFLVNDLTASHLAFSLIKNLNEYETTSDIVLFFENVSSSIIKPNFPVMAMNEIWNFEGSLVSTDINTTLTLKRCFAPRKKVFYVWDLEWMRNGREKTTSFEEIIQAFSDETIELVARSQDHAKAIENLSNRKIKHIVENFNIEKLMRIGNE